MLNPKKKFKSGLSCLECCCFLSMHMCTLYVSSNIPKFTADISAHLRCSLAFKCLLLQKDRWTLKGAPGAPGRYYKVDKYLYNDLCQTTDTNNSTLAPVKSLAKCSHRTPYVTYRGGVLQNI